MQKIPSTPITRYWLVFLVVFSVHNLEEIWRDLPAWSVASSPLRGVIGVPAYEKTRLLFLLAAVGLTVGAALVGYMLERSHSSKSAQWLAVFCALLLSNAFYHIALSLWTQTLMPGVITAVALVIPVNVWILYKLYGLSHNKQAKRRSNI